ncbi:MAG: LysM peptidoglycan-binding domain-containing protein [Lachnospiraceae bacterium]|nr:LysM peptidoglycan-binding domain-containing protein [Lachnospiraceae bacterium]
MKKKMITLALTVLLICSAVICFASTVSAKSSVKREKYIAKVYVEYGDSLWSIASENFSSEYSDTAELVEEIKKINHLYSDKIIAGEYILVPYYD